MENQDKSGNLNAFLRTAHLCADRAGAKILPYFRSEHDVDNKSSSEFDPVTEADKSAETAIRDLLTEHWPDHSVVGEEHDDQYGDSAYNWVVDPIDGTKSFITGLPLWGTLIGLRYNTDPVLGLVDQPFLQERYWSDGTSAFLRCPSGETRISTRACPKLSQAFLSTTSPDLFDTGHEQRCFVRLRDSVRMTRYGGDCYAYCMLMQGYFDIILEAGLKLVDIVAIIPIVEAAGGKITDWKGGKVIDGGQVLATGDPELHQQVLELINS
ncbi:MAG: histidinol-phosphatase [Methyloligellaceae bacterium]